MAKPSVSYELKGDGAAAHVIYGVRQVGTRDREFMMLTARVQGAVLPVASSGGSGLSSPLNCQDHYFGVASLGIATGFVALDGTLAGSFGSRFGHRADVTLWQLEASAPPQMHRFLQVAHGFTSGVWGEVSVNLVETSLLVAKLNLGASLSANQPLGRQQFALSGQVPQLTAPDGLALSWDAAAGFEVTW